MAKQSEEMTVPEEAGTPEWADDAEGQLAIDVYQTNDEVVVKAPIAGVKADNLDISITDEVLTVKGERKHEEEVADEHYFSQECYWGAFSRSYILPVAVDPDKAQAALRDGILTIKIPKLEKTKTRVLKVSTGE